MMMSGKVADWFASPSREADVIVDVELEGCEDVLRVVKKWHDCCSVLDKQFVFVLVLRVNVKVVLKPPLSEPVIVMGTPPQRLAVHVSDEFARSNASRIDTVPPKELSLVVIRMV